MARCVVTVRCVSRRGPIEALYPVAAMLPPVSRFFVSAAHRGDDALLAKLGDADASRAEVGVMHMSQDEWRQMQGNEPSAASDDPRRGAFSLYVPEYYDDSPRVSADRCFARRLRHWPRLPVDMARGSAHAWRYSA